MTKPGKLYDKLLASHSLIISFRDFAKLLLVLGSLTIARSEATANMCIRWCAVRTQSSR